MHSATYPPSFVDLIRNLDHNPTMTIRAEFSIAEPDIEAWMSFVLGRDRLFAQSVRMIRLLVPALTGLIGLIGYGRYGLLIGLVVGALMSWLFVPWAFRTQMSNRIRLENRRRCRWTHRTPHGHVGRNHDSVDDESRQCDLAAKRHPESSDAR